jgi:putative FmdB family regulatory protein
MLATARTRDAGCRRGYHRLVPIYEFRCEACGERFEALVDPGTESAECRVCGAAGARRLLSGQAPRLAHVKSPGATRAQERRNAQLRARTKADFAARRRRARQTREGGSA